MFFDHHRLGNKKWKYENEKMKILTLYKGPANARTSILSQWIHFLHLYISLHYKLIYTKTENIFHSVDFKRHRI